MVMKQKVSQATIDKIKKMGMTKALKGASNANPEMKEALKRMYGARRVAAATASTKPVRMTAREAERNTPIKAKPSVREAERKTPVKKAAAMPKKSGTTDPFAKAVFGAGRTITSGQGAQRMTASQVAATNAKRMGISVAEYNKRLNAAKKK
jgi:hypothetical protein